MRKASPRTCTYCQTKWDPVRKTPRRSAKRYVGRLFEDGRVIPSKLFLESFTQYAGYPSITVPTSSWLMKKPTAGLSSSSRASARAEDAPVKDDVLNAAPGLRGLYPPP